MNSRYVLILGVLLFSSACVFESGPTLPDPSAAQNNGNNVNNENNENNSNNELDAIDLAVEEVECADDEFSLFFPVPGDVHQNDSARLAPDSFFAVGEPAPELRDSEGFAAGFAWARIVQGQIIVAAGSAVALDETFNNWGYEELTGASEDIIGGEEITAFDIGTQEGALYKATIFTTERVVQCSLRRLASESTCVDDDDLQQILVRNDVTPLSRVEFMPFLQRPEPTVLRASLVNFITNLVVLGVGGGANLNSVGIVQVGFGGVQTISINTLTQGRPFYGARLTLGVTDESNGLPYLMMLAQESPDVEPEPAIFVSDGQRYSPRDIEDVDWILHPDVAADPRTFSFVAKNTVRVINQGLVVDYDAQRSLSEFGYVGVGLEPDELIFSTEEPLSTGESFLVYSNESDIVELASGSGIRFFDDLVEHEPLIVLVDEFRDSLTFVRWGLSIDTEWITGVGSKQGLSDIRELQVPSVHYDDSTTVAFKANQDGQPIIGGIFVPEVSRLTESLCIR